jgi:hypothetical protein
MRTLVLLTLAVFVGCTIKIEPIPAKKKTRVVHHYKAKHHATPTPKPLQGLKPEGEIKLLKPEATPTP